ncbi:MAG: putative ABC transporter permease [Firmicutes bacterium]|nr:putative ABC transporter permease [Bacillota bacterium]
MYIWLFMMGGAAGFVLETLFCLLVHRRLEFRGGLLYLPFNPVYGVGTVLLTEVLGLLPFQHAIGYFWVSTVLGGCYEYACSYCQEKVFGTVSWQYNESVGSIGGRTSVPFALCWGLLGMVWIMWICPWVRGWADKIGTDLTIIVGLVMLLDMILSTLAEARHNQRRRGKAARGCLARWLDHHYPDAIMERTYPNAVPVASVPKA